MCCIELKAQNGRLSEAQAIVKRHIEAAGHGCLGRGAVRDQRAVIGLAAGMLLVREAGGYVSELDGGHNMLDSGSVLAANDHLHLPLGTLLRGGTPKPRALARSG